MFKMCSFPQVLPALTTLLADAGPVLDVHVDMAATEFVSTEPAVGFASSAFDDGDTKSQDDVGDEHEHLALEHSALEHLRSLAPSEASEAAASPATPASSALGISQAAAPTTPQTTFASTSIAPQTHQPQRRVPWVPAQHRHRCLPW